MIRILLKNKWFQFVTGKAENEEGEDLPRLVSIIMQVAGNGMSLGYVFESLT